MAQVTECLPSKFKPHSCKKIKQNHNLDNPMGIIGYLFPTHHYILLEHHLTAVLHIPQIYNLFIVPHCTVGEQVAQN
jgi:hypothetical protein